MKTITPALNGFLKGLVLVIVLAVASYIGDAANLSPLVGSTAATIIAMLASSLESHIKDQTGRGLFGALPVS